MSESPPPPPHRPEPQGRPPHQAPHLPPGQPPYQPPPPGYWAPPPRPPRDNSPGLLIGMAFAGLALYSAVNLLLVLVVLFAAMGEDGNPVWTATAAVVLVLVGLGAGAGLLLLRRPWATGLGLGLMIGWALWSIVSAGFCTGINPGLYG